MNWWIWTVFGILLLIGELVTPGVLFFLFFSVGCFFNSALVYFDIVTELWINWMVLAISALSGFILIGRLKSNITGGVGTLDRDSVVGVSATVISKIEPKSKGEVSFRGANWKAVNKTDTMIKVGETVKIVSVNGFTLTVEPED